MTEPTDRQETLQIDEELSLVDQILDEALQAVRCGENLVLEKYYQRYPDVAAELRLLLPALLMMESPKSSQVNSVFQIHQNEMAPTKLLPSRMCAPPVLTDYAIVSEIGRGAMGIVYEAIQLPLKRRVALKVLFQSAQPNENDYRRFLREAEIAARLHHTNIVPVFEFGESDGCYYYAMQLIEGHNLLQLIEAAGSTGNDQHGKPTVNSLMSCEETQTHGLGQHAEEPSQAAKPRREIDASNMIGSPEACAKVALQVAEGLYFAHQRKILHRDIKPSNIIIDCENRAWIADFGLAKADDDTVLTDANDVVGTIRYLAPERFEGECDQRSDIFALGATLYECLHGKPFWSSASRAQLVQQIISHKHGRDSKRPYNCPKDVRRIVEKATDHDPSQRYQTAGELADDLRRFLDGRPVLARQASLLRKVYLLAKRNPVTLSLVTLLCLLATVATIVTASLSLRANHLSTESLKNFENARRNLGFLLETVDKVCLSLGQDQRLNRPEFQELRQQLLQMVIDFNHRFEEVPEVAAEMQLLSAKAQIRLGSMTSGDDTLAESASYLESARSILTEMHQNTPKRDGLSLELARCLRELSSVEWRMGIRESALERNTQAIQLCEQLRLVEAFEGEAEIELARNRLALGGFLSDAGSKEEAEGHFLRAIESLETLKVSPPNSHSHTVELGHANRQLGQYYLANLRQWKLAESPLNKAAELYQLAENHEPGNPDLVANRAKVLFCQAKLSYIGEKRVDAVDKLDQARVLLASLVQTHNQVADYRAQYANTLQRLAEYRIHLDRRHPAIFAYLDNAAGEYTWLIAYDPNNIAYKKGLISTLTGQAELLSLQSQWQQASHCLDTAMSLVSELEFLENSDKFVHELKYFVLGRQAELLANLNRFEESLTVWDQAIDVASDSFRDIYRIQRLRTVVLSGDFVKAISELELLLANVTRDTKGQQHYLGESARVFAIAHRQAFQTSKSEGMTELAEEYAQKTIEIMRELLAIGKLNPDFTESNEDYFSLRSRPDFQEILQAARHQSEVR